MNAVIYFSCTQRSETVARGLASKLDYPLFKLTARTEKEILRNTYESAVIVFPVHCQSYPLPMKNFFRYFSADNITLIATYGSVNAGNAIYEAVRLLKQKPVAAAYVPCSHSYFNGSVEVRELPKQFIEKILSPCTVDIPKRKKNLFAGFLPSLRSRAIIKIKRNASCDKCGKCNGVCPMSAMDCGKTASRCIRCLKCVSCCERHSLEVKRSHMLTRYLEKTHCDEIIIYI